MVSEMALPLFPGFGARASSALLRHDWPGNVRELKNAVERSVYRLKDKNKQITHIAFDPFDSPFRLRETPPVATESPAAERPQVLPVDLSERVDAFERELLEAALEKARFNQRVASDLLGLTYHQLRGKIRKHQLDVRRPA
jgi:psp operon transcriptional activator